MNEFTSNEKYLNWIRNFKGEIFRRCIEVTTLMKSEFPELRIVKGMVEILESEKEYQHQWLADNENKIVDPTAKQWLCIMEYKEIKDGDPIPIGICRNCGKIIYSDNNFKEFCKCRK